MAAQFSEQMKLLRNLMFEKSDESPENDGDFLTRCQLNEDSCAFLVHTPEMSKFDSESQESLADIAWATANRTLANAKLREGSDLAVATRSRGTYRIDIGKFIPGTDAEDRSGVEQSGTSETLLNSFFPVEKTEAEEE